MQIATERDKKIWSRAKQINFTNLTKIKVWIQLQIWRNLGIIRAIRMDPTSVEILK